MSLTPGMLAALVGAHDRLIGHDCAASNEGMWCCVEKPEMVEVFAATLAAAPAVYVHRYVDRSDNSVTRSTSPLWACMAGRLSRGDEGPHIATRRECEHFDCPGPHHILTVGRKAAELESTS
jgi:hypothetical protein